MNIKNKLVHFAKGFKYAFNGIFHCIKHERNMRFHVGMAIIVLYFAHICDFSSLKTCVLYLTIGCVIAFECINTGIENTIDMICKNQKNNHAKIAKDTSAGAVLVMAIASVCVGAKLFLNTNTFLKIYDYFSRNFLSLGLVILYIILWIIWVLMAEMKDKD